MSVSPITFSFRPDNRRNASFLSFFVDARNELRPRHNDSLVVALADSRERTEDELRAIISSGPFSAGRAVELGLVDSVSFPDEAAAALDERLGRGDVPRIELGDYVLVHVGFAISRIDEEAAHETLAALQEMGELAELGPPPGEGTGPDGGAGGEGA